MIYSSTEKHNNNFNFLRLLGACLVIFSHSYDVVGKPDMEPVGIISKGHIEASAIGLSIFFFISGFFVTKSALASPNAFVFIKKRILRIYPALIALVLISTFLAGPLLTTFSLKNYFSNIETFRYLFTGTGIIIRTSLPGVFQAKQFCIGGFNASIWTISIEIALYISLLVVFLFRFLHKKERFSYVSLAIFLAGFFILATCPQLSFPVKRNINLVSIFYFGSFVYTAPVSKRTMLLLLIVSAILYAFLPNMVYNKIDTDFLLLLILSIPVYLFGFSEKIKLNLQTDISYGLYIFAFPVQQWLFCITQFKANAIENVCLSFAVAGVFALLSWQFIEKTFIRLKNKKTLIERILFPG